MAERSGGSSRAEAEHDAANAVEPARPHHAHSDTVEELTRVADHSTFRRGGRSQHLRTRGSPCPPITTAVLS